MNANQITDILELFEVVSAPNPALVTIINESKPMPHNTVTLFTYKKHRYMLLQDDTATGHPEYVRRMFEEAMFIPSEGKILHNPTPQPDGEELAVGYENHEYYVWSYDKDE